MHFLEFKLILSSTMWCMLMLWYVMYECVTLWCTRCGPYFGTTVEAVQCLTYQTEWNVRICKKRQNILCFGVCGRQNFFTLSPSYTLSPKNLEKSLSPTVLELGWVIRNDEMKIWLCLYFQHVTRYIRTDFVEESRQKMQRSEEEHFFRKGCSERVYFKHSE